MGGRSFRNDSLDARTINTEYPRQGMNGLSICVKSYYVILLFRSKFSAFFSGLLIALFPFKIFFQRSPSSSNIFKPIRIPAMSSFSLFVGHVISQCAKKKMLWIYAKWRVARVEYAHIFRDWAVSQLPRNTVGKNLSIGSTSAYHPVSLVVFIGCP